MAPYALIVYVTFYRMSHVTKSLRSDPACCVCVMQAKLAKLRREILEPATGAGGGKGGDGEFSVHASMHLYDRWCLCMHW